MITKQQFERLPKYAQSRIKKLEQDVAWYKTILKSVQEEDTYIYWIIGLDRYYLPSRATVVFNLENGSLSVSRRKGKLQVVGDGQLYIIPSATNYIYITNEDAAK